MKLAAYVQLWTAALFVAVGIATAIVAGALGLPPGAADAASLTPGGSPRAYLPAIGIGSVLALVAAFGTAGALTGGLLGRVLGHDLRAILHTARPGRGEPAAGVLAHPRIREFGEIADSIGLFREMSARRLGLAIRRPIDADRLRTTRDLAATYQARFARAPTVSASGIEVVGGRCGSAVGDFSGGSTIAAGVVAFVGKVRIAGEIEAALEASAVTAFLEGHLVGEPFEGAIEACARIFPLLSLTAVFIPAAAAQAVVLTLSGGSVQSSVIPFRAGAPPLLLHTFAAGNRANVEAHSALFQDLAARDLAALLVGSLDVEDEGVLLAVKR